MLSALIVAASLGQTAEASPPSFDYTATVNRLLTDDVAAWLAREKRALSGLEVETVTVVEIEIDRDGAVRRLALALSSANNQTDDLARAFILTAEPFPAPPPGAAGDDEVVTCLVRIALCKKSLEPTSACFPPNKALAQVAGLANEAREAEDAAARLFVGWTAEADGKVEEAMVQYQRAVEAAPRWDYAARAMGLALVNQKRHTDAMPFLQIYLGQRAIPADVAFLAREVQRFARYKQEQEEWESRVRDHLEKRDIAEGVSKGLPELEPCLEKARANRVLKVGADVLVMSWKIRKDGSVYGSRLEGPRHVVMSAQAECLEASVLGWRFPKFSEGQDVVVKDLPIKIRGSDKEEPKPPPKPVSAELASGTATMSQCMRGQKEIFAYIQNRFSALNQCIQKERAKDPRRDYPKKLGIGFVVEPSGEVLKIDVKHRHYKTGPLHDCLVSALSGSLEPKDGTPCPAAFDLEL